MRGEALSITLPRKRGREGWGLAAERAEVRGRGTPGVNAPIDARLRFTGRGGLLRFARNDEDLLEFKEAVIARSAATKQSPSDGV